MSELGSVLKRAREEAGLSLREVEKRTGIRNAHLSQVETGAIAKPEMAMLWDLAALYRLDYSDLLAHSGYASTGETSGRQRQRTTAALRALGALTPSEQAEVLRYMAELKSRRAGD
jgi:transcriptional regulator with XRE-family HTH domain